MILDEAHPLNLPALSFLAHTNPKGHPAIAPPDAFQSPYMTLGSHPDIVERVWDELTIALAVDCRAVVYGNPALVHPERGIVFALAFGTAYAIRIPGEAMEEAINGGCTTDRTWTGGGKTDIQETLGFGWLFGNWLDAEPGWMLEVYNRIGQLLES